MRIFDGLLVISWYTAIEQVLEQLRDQGERMQASIDSLAESESDHHYQLYTTWFLTIILRSVESR